MTPQTTHPLKRELSDDQIRSMFEAFAGPAAPCPSLTKRRPTRRTVLVVGIAFAALALTVPGALAVLGYWETPKHFLGDRSQPGYAKNMVRSWLRNHAYVEHGPNEYHRFRLLGLTRGVSVKTPDGEVRLYGLRLAQNPRGFVVVPARNADLFAWSLVVPTTDFLVPPWLSRSPADVYHRCRPGWALQYLRGETNAAGGSVAGSPSFAYVIGRASRAVASVRVLYRDGSTTEGAVTASYFLAWIRPTARGRVMVAAKDAMGKTLARLAVAPDGGLDYTTGNPRTQFPCA